MLRAAKFSQLTNQHLQFRAGIFTAFFLGINKGPVAMSTSRFKRDFSHPA